VTGDDREHGPLVSDGESYGTKPVDPYRASLVVSVLVGLGFLAFKLIG
jgi:hypothetical protein